MVGCGTIGLGVIEALRGHGEAMPSDPTKHPVLFGLSVATSIDALAVVHAPRDHRYPEGVHDPYGIELRVEGTKRIHKVQPLLLYGLVELQGHLSGGAVPLPLEQLPVGPAQFILVS